MNTQNKLTERMQELQTGEETHSGTIASEEPSNCVPEECTYDEKRLRREPRESNNRKRDMFTNNRQEERNQAGQ